MPPAHRCRSAKSCQTPGKVPSGPGCGPDTRWMISGLYSQRLRAVPFYGERISATGRADFDWLIADANMAKVLDGKYDSQAQGRRSSPRPTTRSCECSKRRVNYDQGRDSKNHGHPVGCLPRIYSKAGNGDQAAAVELWQKCFEAEPYELVSAAVYALIKVRPNSTRQLLAKSPHKSSDLSAPTS